MNFLTITLDSITVIAAVLASLLWFKSSIIKTPQSFSIHVVKPDEDALLGKPLDGTYMGQAFSDDLRELADNLRRQSKLSSYAAIFAGLSAFMQAMSIIIKCCD